jgi:uncharacterized cupredoxin-like copper-binding protein
LFLRKVVAVPLVRASLPFLALLLLAPLASSEARDVPIEVGTNDDGSMYLTPSNVTVTLGDDVTLRVKNVDRIFHDVALLDYAGNDVEIEVPAGRTESYSFQATVAGDFRLICEVSGHKQKGMFGFLHVVDPNESPAPLLAPLAALLLVALALRRCR